MHRLGTAVAHGFEDRIDVQITFPGRRRPDRPRLLREVDMHRAAVGLRVNRDRGDPEPPCGADHPTGDFSPIGDQDLAEQAHVRNTPKRVGSPENPETGAVRLAESANAKVSLVSTASIMPSSPRRALAYFAWPSASYCARIGALNSSSSAALQPSP